MPVIEDMTKNFKLATVMSTTITPTYVHVDKIENISYHVHTRINEHLDR